MAKNRPGRGCTVREGKDDQDLTDVFPEAEEKKVKGNGKEPTIEEPFKKSAATTLVEMAREQYDFGISTTGETFAIPKTEPRLVAMLRGSKTSLRGRLARDYFREYRRAAPQQALADALLVIDGFAQEAEEQELYLRVAPHDNDLWVDMGDLTGRAIRITPQGWSIEAQPPMLFRRTVLNGALPDPERGGSLDELWGLLNVTAPDRPLVTAWLIAALFHDIPHPVLCFFGEQGTGKTTAHKMLVTAIDPGPVPIRKPPRDSDSWVTAAAGSWFVGIDNLSDVQPWLSDSICRAVTGDGDVRRKLYTDGEHAVFAFRRCVCLNGIDLGASRGDLSERMLPITLDRISEKTRRSEDEIWSQWEQCHPRILGAILDLAVQVVAALPSVELVSMPRMADFAKILAVVDSVLGTSGLSHYLSELENLAADSLTGDCFILAVMELSEQFEGTSTELLNKVTSERPPRGWPKTPRNVTTRLKRHAPAMRKAGWQVENDGGRNKSNALIWTLVRPEEGRKSSSPDSLPRQNTTNGESTSIASEEYGPSQDGCCPHCRGEGCERCLFPPIEQEYQEFANELRRNN